MSDEQRKQIESIMMDAMNHHIGLSEAMDLIEDVVHDIRSDAKREVE